MYWCVIPCLEVCLRVVYSFEAFMIIYYSYSIHPPLFIPFFSTTTTTTTSNSNDSSNKHSKSIDPSHSFHTPTHPAPASSSLPHTTYLSTSSHPSPCPPSPSSTPSFSSAELVPKCFSIRLRSFRSGFFTFPSDAFFANACFVTKNDSCSSDSAVTCCFVES